MKKHRTTLLKSCALLGLLGIALPVWRLDAQHTGPAASARSVADLEKRLDVVEARLGRNVTTPTATNNLERRLDDLDDRIEKLEQKMKDLDKLERRVRELERKR